MEVIHKYLSFLSGRQVEQIAAMASIYRSWNARINVISRKDMDSFYLHHVLHSMSIGLYRPLENGMRVLDLGSGGGFPGIPLAVWFPEVAFHLIDGKAKKVKVIRSVAEALRLENVRATHIRAEDIDGHYDLVITRAVAPLGRLISWTRRLLTDDTYPDGYSGLIALKGGDLKQEILDANIDNYDEVLLGQYFDEKYFEEKKLLFVPKMAMFTS